MSRKKLFLSLLLLIILLCVSAWFLLPELQVTPYHITQKAGLLPPTTIHRAEEEDNIESYCANNHPEWRAAQIIEGVNIDLSPACEPDNPYEIAAAVKGTNTISMMTLMQTDLAQDALIMGEDIDKDGDPDIIEIKLEVIELNGASPDGDFLINTFDIAPNRQPALWAYSLKSRGMGVKNFNSKVANPLLRAPSPSIRVEQGDKVIITLENTHYLPHTIHLHGVDHPWHNSAGEDNDGTEEHAVFPGQNHHYEIQPRHAGTMLYHCHVQTAQHLMMGLSGLFIVEENQPNNWLQTFNTGAGQVRHSSVTVKKSFTQEYDLHYQAIDKRLMHIVQANNDPRLIAQAMNRRYNMNESFENYFLLNGHSFPYTLRDSMIIANANEKIKLRIANTQRSAIALHFHGHKGTITAYDGVDIASVAQITRDVFDIAPAQRVDLVLNTQDDGIHSYGAGLWMFHDHVPTGTTTDGIEPGGNMAILAYQSLLDAQGMPTRHDELLNEVFNKDYYTKKHATWAVGDFAELLGEAGLIAPNYWQLMLLALIVGLIIGLMRVLVLMVKGDKA